MPVTLTVPLVGSSKPQIKLSKEDLPEPEGPMTATRFAPLDAEIDITEGMYDFAVAVVLAGLALAGWCSGSWVPHSWKKPRVTRPQGC